VRQAMTKTPLHKRPRETRIWTKDKKTDPNRGKTAGNLFHYGPE